MRLSDNSDITCTSDLAKNLEEFDVDSIAYARNDMFYEAYRKQLQQLGNQLNLCYLVVLIDEHNDVIDGEVIKPQPIVDILATRIR